MNTNKKNKISPDVHPVLHNQGCKMWTFFLSFGSSARFYLFQQDHHLLYAFLWVFPRRLNFKWRRFGTLFHLHRQVGVPKRRHIKFGRRGNTQKKTNNI